MTPLPPLRILRIMVANELGPENPCATIRTAEVLFVESS